jgi:hypothetical protein
MQLEQRIQAFHKLGSGLQTLAPHTLEQWCVAAGNENPWFTPQNISLAIKGICTFLEEKTLRQWIRQYPIENIKTKTIATIMAGNIPLVGFHDFLCVLISGHNLMMKVSSKDSYLFKQLVKELITIEPGFQQKIVIEESMLKDFDAVIATGSDNSARYFHQYFRKYPNIIRKNRSSCAALTGGETEQKRVLLGNDVFAYFGLGCRNVSKLYVPENYDLKILLDSWKGFQPVIHHHKYCNNYDYQKAILLVNQQAHLDTGYVLLQESENLVSPISVLYYEYYQSEDDLINKIIANRNKLQCIVGAEEFCTVNFGETQTPSVSDYADDVDTLAFLVTL